MDKLYALLFALLITGLIASDIFLFKSSFSENNSGRESVIISRVIDGDTVELQDGRTLRLLNINSPEKGVMGSELSKLFLKSFENSTVEIEITSKDKYNRELVRIYSPEYLNLEIVRRGFASKFLVQESELREFYEAEEKAIEGGLGIWKKSSHSGCFNSEIGDSEEIVVLENKCGVYVGGWTLKDESRKIYKFSNMTFEEINLHSSKGTENGTDLFWQSATNIWNSDRDTLYLSDSEGGLVHHESYGY